MTRPKAMCHQASSTLAKYVIDVSVISEPKAHSWPRQVCDNQQLSLTACAKTYSDLGVVMTYSDARSMQTDHQTRQLLE